MPRKGVGEHLKRGGVPSEVDPARSPACCATGTQGMGRGGRGMQGPQRTMGTRHRVLRGGKGGGRAFGQCPRRKAVGRGGQTGLAVGLEGDFIQERKLGRSQGCRTLGTRRERRQRGGRGVIGHGNGANGEDRGDRSRGGDQGRGSTTNQGRSGRSAPTSRRGQLEHEIQPWADLLAESLPLELGHGRGRQVEDLEHIGKKNTLQSLHRAELRG